MQEEQQYAYRCSHEYRGRALIIANGDNRERQRKDFRAMGNFFKALDFKVTAYKDIKVTDLREKLKAACDDDMNKSSDYFALAISAVGSEAMEISGKKLGKCDTMPEVRRHYLQDAGGDKLSINEIFHIIGKSERLREKPKLIFIQSYRSDISKFDKALDVNVMMPDFQQRQPSDAEESLEEFLHKEIRTATSDTSATSALKVTWTDPEALSGSQDWDADTHSETGHEHMEVTESAPAAEGAGRVPEGVGRDPESYSAAVPDLPRDCLLFHALFPVVSSGVSAFSPSPFQIIFRNIKGLFQLNDIVKYFTVVSGGIAAMEIQDRDQIVKVQACLQHTLCGKVQLYPKAQNSVMDKVRQSIQR